MPPLREELRIGMYGPIADAILLGVRRYIGPDRIWRIRVRTGGGVGWLAEREFDGLLIHPPTASELLACLELGLPTVCTSARFPLEHFDRHGVELIKMDERAIGRLAAGHLLRCGLQHFAAAGMHWTRYFRLREEGFRGELEPAGGTSETFWLDRADPLDPGSAGVGEHTDEAMRDWLLSLPKPCGLFVTDAGYADRFAENCRAVSLSVPDDVAIISGHDSFIASTLATPSLTAIDLPFEQLGYRAGECLDRLIHGRPIRPRAPLQPLGVIERESTAMLATDNAIVRAALGHIRQNALRPCSVEEVLAEVGCSRSYLDREFRNAFGHTAFAEIRRHQIEAAQELLTSTQEPMDAIARRCGFSGGIRFSTVFKQETGRTPSEYRRHYARR